MSGYERTLSNKNLLEEIGSNCSAQYQTLDIFGGDCLWGSLKDASGNPVAVTNNSRSGFARSYNNDLGYIEGTPTMINQTECEKITDTSSNTTGSYCAMAGRINNATSPSTSAPYNGTTQDSTRRPEYISNNSDDKFTMRGSMYYGNYYNWYAVTAESGKFDMGSNANATDSICPRGWQLPINGGNDTDKSWQHLINGIYGYVSTNGYSQNNRKALSKIFSLPMSVPFAGYYEWTNGALYNRGDVGDYWSSTATATGEGTNAYYLIINYGGFVNPQRSNNKTYGFTIRCVAE